MNKNMELHKLCEMLPVADQRTLDELADSIKIHGQLDAIVLFDGKILDGRNRLIACGMAEVEPIFEEYDKDKYGDNPYYFVMNRNHNRRHMNESQRSFLGYTIYALAKAGDIPNVTLEDIATQFNVSERLVRSAGNVKESASETVQKAVREGAVRVSKAADAIKQAARETGIIVKKDTLPEEKLKAHEAQERILNDELLSPPPTKPAKTPLTEFQSRVLSGEFNGKLWKRNIGEIQDTISRLGKLPDLFCDCTYLLKHLDDERTLAFCVSALSAAIKKVEERLQRDDQPDLSEVRKVLESLMLDKFQIPDEIENDFGAADKRKLLEDLKNKLLTDCRECAKAAEKIGKELVSKHGELEKVIVDQTNGTTKVSPSEFAKYIRAILTNDQSKCVISFEDDIVPYYGGERVAASEFVEEYGFEVIDGKLQIANADQ
jgi:hypothetical protein